MPRSTPAPAPAKPVLLLLGCLGVVSVLPGCIVNNPNRPAARVERSNTYLEDARRLLEQGLDDAALATLSLAIEENPKLTDAYLEVAQIQKRRGNFEEAGRQYEAAIAVNPQNFDAQYGNALIKQITGRVREAVRGYLTALTINPNSFLANRDLSAAYLQLGEPAQALPYAQRATRLNPDAQPAWSNLAVTYSMLGRWEGAINAYRMAAELGELDDPVLLGLADAHIRMGNYGRAINTLETLMRRSPTATAFERMGYANFKLRRFERALEYYDAALVQSSEDTAALNGKGVCHVTLFIEGRYENPYHKVKGIEAWRKSLSINPNQPRIIDLLARYGQK